MRNWKNIIRYREHDNHVYTRYVFAPILFIALFVFGSTIIALGQSVQQLYQSANQAYKTNKFDTAVAGYEKIIAQGYKSAEVYYNLGNCYYKTGSISKCILNYERALKLSPQDDDIQHNLKIANLKVVDKIIPVPQMQLMVSWNNFLTSKSSKGWGNLALISVWLALIAFAVYLFTGFKRMSLSLGFLLLFFSASFLAFGYKQSEKEQNSDAAILTVSNILVKSAPDIGGNDLFMLHEGIKFEVLDRVGDWNKIRLADGKVGWVERASFEKI